MNKITRLESERAQLLQKAADTHDPHAAEWLRNEARLLSIKIERLKQKTRPDSSTRPGSSNS